MFGREEYRLQMEITDADIWKIATDKVQLGHTYLYLADNYHGKHMVRTDSMSFTVIYTPKVHQVQSVVHDETVYQWGDQNWVTQREQTDSLRLPLSIYEIQAKSWKSDAYQPLKFRQIAPDLVTYCHQMGFAHLEMYGILEHAYKGSSFTSK
jgi:1,4-alpha-glucan branching enzyme